MKNILLLFVLFAIVYPLEAISPDRLSGKCVRFYKPSEYKSDAQVWPRAHGLEDDMFFATNKGVVLFDGVRWEKYMTPSECVMRSVFYDPEENILYSEGVNEFGNWEFDRYGQLQYTCLYQNPRNLPAKEFWRIVKVPYSHLVYFQSPVALLVMDMRNGEISLMVQVDQELIFLNNEGSVYKYNELQDALQEDTY